MATTTASPRTIRASASAATPKTTMGAAVAARELYVVFGVVFALCVAVAAWFMLSVQSVIGDALSRSLAALTAAKSAYPKLASLGFIWPPLPSLIQIPLAHIPGFSTYGFMGGIMTALFAAGTAVVFDLIFARAGMGRLTRLVGVALLVVFNPFMLFYGTNGMSEMPLIFFVVFSTYCFLCWTDTDRVSWLMAAGIATACMVLVRYDAWFYAAAFVGAIVLALWRGGEETLGSDKRSRLSMVSANVLTYAIPVAFTTFLWILFNWQIKGNALYFLNSEYSNAYLIKISGVAETPIVRYLQASPINFVGYILETILGLSPLLLIGFAALLALAFVERAPKYVALAALLLAVPVFEWVSYRQGQTFGFWRYYITLIPAGAIAVAELVRYAHAPHTRRAAIALLLGGLGLGSLTIAVVMDIGGAERFMDSGPICSSNRVVDQDFLRAIFHPATRIDACAVERDMAQYILTHTDGRSTLTDISAEGVVMMSDTPNRFVLLSDGDYATLAANPIANGVTHLVVSRGDLAYHALDGYFTDLQKENPPGLILEHQSGKLRLYRIAPDYR